MINKANYMYNRKNKVFILVFVIIFLICFIAYPCFFIIGPLISGYRIVSDPFMDGFLKPLAHIDDDASYIIAYKCDKDHYMVIDDSDHIKSLKNWFIFYENGSSVKNSEYYGELIIYRDGIDSLDNELRYYIHIYSPPAQWRFDIFFFPYAKKLTIADYEQYCIDHSLSPPYNNYIFSDNLPRSS